MVLYEQNKVRIALLNRLSRVFVDKGDEDNPSNYLEAIDIKLAQLGYCLSYRLRERIQTLPLSELSKLQEWLWKWLSLQLGSNEKHVPLFRKFPEDVPADTTKLWWKKVLSHFMQGKDKPCFFCGQVGTTHVLNPCSHVICDSCFDGSNYSACPVCEHAVDRSSPFFKPSTERPLPKEEVTFKRLDLGVSLSAAAQKVFQSFCARTQAMGEKDRTDLISIISDCKESVFGWLPEDIPVKENIALIFGTLFRECEPSQVFPVAKKYLKTATDVLRFIITSSGGDPSLQPVTVTKSMTEVVQPERWWGEIAKLLGKPVPGPTKQLVRIPLKVRRTKIRKMSRSLRRALLQLLNEMSWDNLIEDMLRHRSWWIWVGQFLHPHEYRKRFPRVAEAFKILRKKSPDGKKAEPYRGFYSKLEQFFDKSDAGAALALLEGRPGELARRLDHLIRLAGDDTALVERVVQSFIAKLPKFSLPVLATLRNFLPTRIERAPFRIYWPKGLTSRGVSAEDERRTLPPGAVEQLVSAIEKELLRRFGNQERFSSSFVDVALMKVMVPFNERTASPAAVSLPRGSTVPIDSSKTVRMFLHWCEPKRDGVCTDLDLSVGFYDDKWEYKGVCSYYQLKYIDAEGFTEEDYLTDASTPEEYIAVSAGDLQEAPFPDGASEFVDLNWKKAQEKGIRYAVMVINSYSGLPFSELERAFAGLMLRDDKMGKHFDPRTVKLRFSLRGEQGVYLPLVFDLQKKTLHWLDVYSKGEFLFNNVETSNKAIQSICPQQITYFQSSIRMTMFELALLHSASRSEKVYIRNEHVQLFQKAEGESKEDFFKRLLRREGGATVKDDEVHLSNDSLVALYEGDMSIPDDSKNYVLFPEKATGNIEASDLLAQSSQ